MPGPKKDFHYTVHVGLTDDEYKRMSKAYEFECEQTHYRISFVEFVRRGLRMLLKDVEYRMKVEARIVTAVKDTTDESHKDETPSS